MGKQINCRYFRGDRPCTKAKSCDSGCVHLSVPDRKILIIHLGALGAVVRSTAFLAALKRKCHGSHVTWVTDAPADQLLFGHPQIDRVLTTRFESILEIAGLHFDEAFVIDKSLKASGVLEFVSVGKTYGFVKSPSGAILPATLAADELWQLGLDNDLKFYKNQKPETQLVIEALELGPWQRDEYSLPLVENEEKAAKLRKNIWSKSGTQFVVGLNTGCSEVIAAKKLTVAAHTRLAQKFLRYGVSVVLLGGPEDQERNEAIQAAVPAVLRSPEKKGLRDGLVSVAACDAVVTGDSLGMHMAISQKKWVTAWFGPTCAQEIDLYERGVSILSKATCAPCWKRTCQQEVMCYDQVDLDEIVTKTLQGLSRGCQIQSPEQFLLSRQPFSEICS